MPQQHRLIYDEISTRMAEVLRGCAMHRSESEIARELGIETSSVRSALANLRDIVGHRDKRDLGSWWADHHGPWMERVRQRIEPTDEYTYRTG